MQQPLDYQHLNRMETQQIENVYNALLAEELDYLSQLIFHSQRGNPRQLQNKHQVMGWDTQATVLVSALLAVMQDRAKAAIVLRLRYAEKLNIQIPEVIPHGA
jgi:uncharacterized protein YciW